DHVETAGSATVKSVRCARGSRCLTETHSPSIATVSVAGAGPTSTSDVNTKMSENETVAERPGILMQKRPATMVSTPRTMTYPFKGAVRVIAAARIRANAPATATTTTNNHVFASAVVDVGVVWSIAVDWGSVAIVIPGRRPRVAPSAIPSPESTTSRGQPRGFPGGTRYEACPPESRRVCA